MKNTLSLQQQYYNHKVAADFDRKRMNANHIYKIEVIEGFFHRCCKRKKDLRIMELGGVLDFMLNIFWKMSQNVSQNLYFAICQKTC